MSKNVITLQSLTVFIPYGSFNVDINFATYLSNFTFTVTINFCISTCNDFCLILWETSYT
jgi:hypothetical protein